ncbi:hypothetical protein OZL92_11835 [Bacillus sonorensis]|uniref:Abortive phage infection protein n=2 Tax=Bacillus sonorensis TaxID=119858 RepID=M5P3D4_9BACI|nr:MULTISPECIES: hypothetical protein [Bacillus]TWK71847.1 hypothetical protein CHCC20335_2483 [Bacillus paralicheniformis]ASB89872.1 uncharacterized protein S101395_03365 [Bacillus sonorensis]EME74546.1 hypothetical protein BSONL12_12181 [Bacillus sonorensis L12]MBG9916893.1 hypothetical protein [Bacillus sonorensis]MCF7619121.1 hypothetical protein [Bacillus sonorensis]
MTEENAIELIENLRSGSIHELRVKKEDFLSFRAILTKQEDFKHFRGIAQRGGDIIFQYMKEPRS